jgi:hypothetical protein
VSESTVLAYLHSRDLLLDYLGPRALQPVRTLQKSDVVAFRDHLRAEGRTAGTVNTLVKKFLTGPFEAARKKGLIDYNPFVAVDALKSKNVAKDGFSPEQVTRLIQVTRGTDWEGAILVGYTTGMRFQDVANLRWSKEEIKGIYPKVKILYEGSRDGRKRVQSPLAFSKAFRSGIIAVALVSAYYFISHVSPHHKSEPTGALKLNNYWSELSTDLVFGRADALRDAMEQRTAIRETMAQLRDELAARLPRLIGRGGALEVLLGADDLPGELAELYGYVNRALPDAELDTFVDALARRIASFDKQAIGETTPGRCGELAYRRGNRA